MWDDNPDAPDPVTPFVKTHRAWGKQLLGSAAAGSPTGGKGEVSDGYHTFNEFYEHRHALFLALARAMPENAWASRRHADGSKIEGWFVAGLRLTGARSDAQITYHLPDRLWFMAETLGIVTDDPPEFDGHTSDDVVRRLMTWARWK